MQSRLTKSISNGNYILAKSAGFMVMKLANIEEEEEEEEEEKTFYLLRSIRKLKYKKREPIPPF
tara:strand:+ start:1035 stop:1226 length:192 start_codon:yes stop_codon:yes gene_type:complete